MSKIKFLFITIFPLLLINCATTLPPASTTPTEIDQADTILITVDESADEAYSGFAQHLSSNGFGFENTDETLRVLKTDMNEGKNLAFSYALNVSVIDTDSSTVVQVNGSGNNDMLGDFELEKRGMSGSLIMEGWNQMKQIVTSYDHQSVYFKRN